MADSEHLAIFKQGSEAWNAWRKAHPDISPDLTGLNRDDYAGEVKMGADGFPFGYFTHDLDRYHMRGVNLSFADLGDSTLSFAQLASAVGVPAQIPHSIIEQDPRMVRFFSHRPLNDRSYVSDPSYAPLWKECDRDAMPAIEAVRAQAPARFEWMKERIRTAPPAQAALLTEMQDDVEIMFRRNDPGTQKAVALEMWTHFAEEKLQEREKNKRKSLAFSPPSPPYQAPKVDYHESSEPMQPDADGWFTSRSYRDEEDKNKGPAL